ncbi:hypothetical protein GGI12_005357 [Dipsacomyces acuminosporus]|nr:hypothetical protein GGI12_005357 [Dipsacomyces acuminosporus]
MLSERLARHVQGNATEVIKHTDPKDGELGTGIKLVLRFRRRTLYIIGFYIPPKSQHNDPYIAPTRNKILDWLKEARTADAEVICGGDINEHLWREKSHSLLGRYLSNSAWLKEVWSLANPSQEDGLTFPLRQPVEKNDFLYISNASLGIVRQTARSSVQTEIREGHAVRTPAPYRDSMSDSGPTTGLRIWAWLCRGSQSAVAWPRNP